MVQELHHRTSAAATVAAHKLEVVVLAVVDHRRDQSLDIVVWSGCGSEAASLDSSCDAAEEVVARVHRLSQVVLVRKDQCMEVRVVGVVLWKLHGCS